MKETAKALRAKNNITGTTSIKRRLPFRRKHLPSYSSSDDDSEGHSNRNSIKGNENSPEDDDDGDLTFEETPHVSGDGNPNTSTKRHRSSSPIHHQKLGSMENPIDVDGIASLFEPKVIKEYVWKFFIHSVYAEYMW